VLILSHGNAICKSQIFPFFYYRAELRERYGIELREQDVASFLAGGGGWVDRADIVILQPWFDIGEEGLQRLLDQVEKRCRPHHVVFLDGYAPTDLRFARVLDERVDLYVKKHALRDRSQYGKATQGDSFIVEYYCRRYGCARSQVTFDVPQTLLEKLIVGPTFFTADYMLEAFLVPGPALRRSPVRFDVHARLSRTGSDWYERMRAEALSRLEAIEGLRSAPSSGVSRARFLEELRSSKLCLSPFGYGEIAWRDYEAVLNGSVLLKPDTSHVETRPNIFVNHETYLPIGWDFSGMEEMIDRFVNDEAALMRVATNAYRVVHEYVVNQRFVEDMAPLFTQRVRTASPVPGPWMAVERELPGRSTASGARITS
jgi:hypothetical protein